MPFWPVTWNDLKVARTPARAGRKPRQAVAEDAPACVYLLAENLDAVLAAGEDLRTAGFNWNEVSTGTLREIAASRREQRANFDEIRTLELALVARALKARERAGELAAIDMRFAPLAKLYSSGTALLLDVAGDLAAETELEFNSGNAMTGYLRSRGVLAAGDPAPEDGSEVMLGEDVLIAGRVPLGGLLDLAAQFLDALEIHYDLFEAAAVASDDPPATASGD